MRTEHLTEDELEALARDEETGPDVRRHLASCAECREAAREGMFATLYVRPLAGDHPDEHVLTALWSHALSPARKKDVERHVAACSRCRALLRRLMRATPPESSPSFVGDGWLKRTEDWAVTSTAPRRATLVVRDAKQWELLQASFVAIAEPLRLLTQKPRSREWTWKRRPPEAPALGDGRLGFRFKPYREGTATYLAVALVRSPAGLVIPSIAVSSAGASGHPQHAEIRAGVEAVLELSPGTFQLLIEVEPRWEIEVRFDA